MVALDESVGSGLTASERQPVFIVDTEGLISSQLYQGVERILRRHATFWQKSSGKTGVFADSEGTDIVIGSVLRKFPAKYGFGSEKVAKKVRFIMKDGVIF